MARLLVPVRQGFCLTFRTRSTHSLSNKVESGANAATARRSAGPKAYRRGRLATLVPQRNAIGRLPYSEDPACRAAPGEQLGKRGLVQHVAQVVRRNVSVRHGSVRGQPDLVHEPGRPSQVTEHLVQKRGRSGQSRKAHFQVQTHCAPPVKPGRQKRCSKAARCAASAARPPAGRSTEDAISFQNGAPATSSSRMWCTAIVSGEISLPGFTRWAPRSSASSHRPSAPIATSCQPTSQTSCGPLAGRLQVDNSDALHEPEISTVTGQRKSASAQASALSGWIAWALGPWNTRQPLKLSRQSGGFQGDEPMKK